MHLPRSMASLILVLAALVYLARANAEANDSAEAFIMAKQAKVVSLLHRPESPEREKQIGQVLDGMVDYDLLAKRSMESHWDELSPSQRKEFTGLLRHLVQRSYERNIKGILDWNVEYLTELPASPGFTVRTRATSKTNTRSEPITIDYQVIHESEGLRVYDIVTEGSSLVNNYRNQFNRILAHDGYDALIRRMKSKIQKGGEAHAQ